MTRDVPLYRLLTKALPALLLAATIVPKARATIRYEVSLEHPERHILSVKMTIPDVADGVTVQMPAWNALYQIRDFSSHVRRIEARTETGDAPIVKVDKQTWRITGTGVVTIAYATYWDEPGPFATQLNAEHAFINPAMILMYVPERRSEDAWLALSDFPSEWSPSTSLTPVITNTKSDTRRELFVAENYDALADSPIEVGAFVLLEVPGVRPEVLAVVHGDKWNRKQVGEELRRICSYQTKLMEGAPYKRYSFIVHIGKAAAGAGGGMEHANSTAIFVRSEEDLLNVAAHEFFHLWNVKRIRPATLDPVDYTGEQYTRALWFAEGVTSTYAAYTLVRTQLWSKEQLYFDLSQQISELESRPANQWQSAEESSLNAWLEKYPLYNRPQESISYYTKGQVLGVLLDILIRDRTNNEKSLDDVLRAMNARFAQQNKPYRDSLDVQLTAEEVAGGSFGDFFARYVSRAEALPYGPILELAGLDLRAATRRRPVLGFYAEREASGELTVKDVDSESAAAELRPGDVIVNWNGAEPPRNAERWLASQKSGSVLRLSIHREGKEMSVSVRIGEAIETFYQVAENSHAGEKARRIREGLLHGTTQPVTAGVH